MKKISKKELFFLSIALFSMFFGSGNLIFPPWMGYQSGEATWISMIGFGLSAVVFPILGIIAIVKFGSLEKLSSRVGKKFAVLFPIIAFLAIGPGLAIPRNAAVSFEMAVIPFFKDASMLVRIMYSIAFFGISYFLCVHPEKLTDTLGKVLGPIMIILMIIVSIGCFFHIPSSFLEPSGNYESSQLVQGFLDGYNTMDTIAALNFGAIVAMNVKEIGIHKSSDIVSCSVKTGWIAGIFMFVIYALMSVVGAISATLVPNCNNGAGVLSGIVGSLFGMPGLLTLACIYILSCLTTCIGLLCSCSTFFASISKYSYIAWVRLFTIISCIVSVVGLNQILEISVPILTMIYPIAMVLVILGLCDEHIQKYPSMYKFSIFFSAIASLIYALHSLNIQIPYITNFMLSLPPSADLCWIIPAILGCLVGIWVDRFHKKN